MLSTRPSIAARAGRRRGGRRWSVALLCSRATTHHRRPATPHPAAMTLLPPVYLEDFAVFRPPEENRVDMERDSAVVRG